MIFGVPWVVPTAKVFFVRKNAKIKRGTCSTCVRKNYRDGQSKAKRNFPTKMVNPAKKDFRSTLLSFTQCMYMFMVFDACSKVYVVLYYIDISSHQAPSACILGPFWRDHQTNMFSTCDAEATCTFTSKTSRKSNDFFWHGHIFFYLARTCWWIWCSGMFWLNRMEKFYLDWISLFYRPCFAPSMNLLFRLRMSASLATVASYAACNHSSGIQILWGIDRGLKHVWGLLKLCHLSIFSPFHFLI